MRYYLRKYGIKTIVNLRGENPGQSWYEDEKRVAQEEGVLFYSIAMSAVRMTTKQELAQLLNIYANAPRPIYIHCQGGADRTGEAAAIWAIDQMGQNNSEALNQLGLQYGHRKYKNGAKDLLIQNWQGREWALNRYDPELLVIESLAG